MGILHRNRKGVPAEIKGTKPIKGEHVSVYEDKLVIMKWKDKKDVCLKSTSHDNKMAAARVQEQDMEKPIVVMDYNSRMGGVDLSDVYLIS
jgi:hypothetical protein